MFKVRFEHEGQLRSRAMDVADKIEVYRQVQEYFPGAKVVEVVAGKIGPGGYWFPLVGHDTGSNEVKRLTEYDVALLLQKGILRSTGS